MGNNYVYTQPVKIWFGAGKLAELGQILEKLGFCRCLLVCGRHFVPQAGKLAADIPAVCGIFSEVEANPQLSGAVQAARLARETDAEAILGIGGGSVIDTAKFAAAVAADPDSAEAMYRGEKPFSETALPVIAVPTTAGTGSEVTQVSVISHGAEKRTMNRPCFMPKAAVVDPELTLTAPPYTTMITGLDAMAHALEGYWSVHHQPIPDLMAVEAVRLILKYLERAWRNGEDLKAREALAQASLLGGLSFAVPKTAACHACSYPLSEDCHLPHGEACAFTLDSFVRINADERLEELCRRVGLSGCEELAEKIAAFKQMAGLKTRLAELGEGADPAQLARKAAVHPLMQNNPVPMDEAALKAMFKKLR